jgi:4'-phosphopantetheinyl transferase EntD
VSAPPGLEQALGLAAPPGSGVAVEAVGDGDLGLLCAEERRLVERARSTRRAEFVAGRSCAHRALAAIDADVDAIGRGSRGQPLWPVGIIGSISHTAGVAAAVVAPVSPSVAGLGIDLEQVGAVESGLWPEVMDTIERAACTAATDPAVSATAVFGAKEAAFKALYPVLGTELGFLDAHVRLGTGDLGEVEVPSLGLTIGVRRAVVGAIVVSVAVVGRGA